MDNKLQIILADHDIGNTNIDETLSRIEKLIKQHDDHLLVAVLGAIDQMPERGFGIPQVGSPDHAKGTFTKHISVQECRQAITQVFERGVK